MSAIVGHIGPRARGLEAQVQSARDAMTHRGPDDAGLWTGDHAALGARRRSTTGPAPMVSADGCHVLVFDGAIYNHAELRAELARDVPFRSGGDAEVILQGFRVWGWDRLLDRMNGTFAFAIWDTHERTLYAARDRMGEKPFFLARHDDGLSFASTLTALLRLRGGPAIVDPFALDAYLTFGAVPAPLTMFEEAAQLPPAHELRFSPDTGELRVSRYWELRFAPKDRSRERDALDTLDAIVRRSIARRLDEDAPTGMLLSGGADSCLVSAIASQESGRTLDAVTIGFHEARFDERPFTRLLAARHGVTLHEEVLTPRVATDLPAIVWRYGQPLADVSIVPDYYAARAARRLMSVALVGDGADELFGRHARPRGIRAASFLRALLPAPVRRALGVQLRDDYHPRLHAALDGWHPDSLDRDASSHAVARDVSAMSHSLEARSPFLGREVLEYVATLPESLRVRRWTSKYLLERLAERYVPGETLHRHRPALAMPASEWLRGDLAPFARATLDSARFLDRGWLCPDAVRRLLAEHATGARDWGQQLWTMMILEIWARLALDGSLAPDDPLDVHVLAESAR